MLLIYQDHAPGIDKSMLRQGKNDTMLLQVHSILVVVPLKCGLGHASNNSLLDIKSQYEYMAKRMVRLNLVFYYSNVKAHERASARSVPPLVCAQHGRVVNGV